MEYSYGQQVKSPTMTRLAVVGMLHLIIGYGLIHSMNVRAIKKAAPQEYVINIPPLEEPVKPPEPEKVVKKAEPPPLAPPVPVVEVQVQEPPPPSPMLTRTMETNDAAPSTNTAPAQPEGDAVAAPDVRTAARVDANGCEKPSYPPSAARLGATGTVTLSLLVGVDGTVASAKIQKSSGSHELDVAARNALSLCKFVPATVNGVAQQAWSAINYVWTLDS